MRKNRELILALILVLIVAIIYTWATWEYFTKPVPGGNDFLAHYSVWDIYIDEGVNPYSDEAALYTQELIRGRPAEPGEDQNRLTYPFYSILIHGPFTFIDYALARAIYMTFLQAAIVVSVILVIKLLSWRLSIWMVGFLLSWSILHYPESRAIILGQFAPIGFLSLAGCLFLLQRNRDLLAGIVIVISTIKPTLIFLVFPFLILWALVRRKWNFILGMFSTVTILILGSLILLPSWISDWLGSIAAYPGYTVGQSPIWLLSHEYFSWLGDRGETIITVILVIGLLYLWWWNFSGRGSGSFVWVIGMTLLISNLVVSRSATTNYVMLLLPSISLFSAIDRKLVRGRAIILFVMAISLVGHWWLHYATVVGNQEQSILFLPIPIVLGFALIAGKSIVIKDSVQFGSLA